MKRVHSEKNTRKPKRVHWNQLPVPPKQRFRAACRIIEEVGDCGEDMTAALLGGRVISDQTDLEVTMDVLQEERHLGIEVKMCNHTHEHRPVVGQITRLYEGTRTPGFIMDVRQGVYSLNFYNGVKTSKNGKRKSKIMSRKLGAERRRGVIAREMQYIYLVDNDLMHCFATAEQFRKRRKLMKHAAFCDASKTYREDYTMVCLNRTFLLEFMKGEGEMSETHLWALNSTYGEGQWIVQEKVIKMRFVRKNGNSFVKEIPIRMIGSKKNVKVLHELVTRKRSYTMLLDVPKKDVAKN